jgi:hypothetical protein
MKEQQMIHRTTTLFDNADFRLQAQLTTVASPKNGYAFTITSQRRESRLPHEKQTRFFACLDRNGLQALYDLIGVTLEHTHHEDRA